MKLLPEKLPDCLDKPVEKTVTPLAENVGKTLGDLWFLIFGGISHAAEKKRLKYALGLKAFKESLEAKVKAIPNENRIEPDTQNVCQAMENAKYCVENEDLREMFANLIASTMDKEKYKQVHPSYSEILKQMTSCDAQLLKNFIYTPNLPICAFQLKCANGSFTRLTDYTYFKKNTDFDVETNSIILTSLERLGVIKIHIGEWLNDDRLYQIYENSDIFMKYKKMYNNNQNEVVIEKGFAALTPLGKILLKVCCPPTKVIESTLDLTQYI